MTNLNFGCGNKHLRGFLNIDERPEVAEFRMDMNKFPYHIKNSSSWRINCDNVLEHLFEPTKVLREFHRILRKNGNVLIRVPHFTSGTALSGDVHMRAFSTDFFITFEDGNSHNYQAGCGFSHVKTRIIFPHGCQVWNYPIEWLVNRNRQTQRLYEHSFLRIFPAEQIEVEMRK
jgi:SAM-dependent methyltransferase